MINKPYRRIIRPFAVSDAFDPYSTPGAHGDSYIKHSEYAPERISLVRAFFGIEHDLLKVFEFVEPAEDNLGCFSHRLYELFLRSCTEFESNCKGILQANGYNATSVDEWDIRDFNEIEQSSKLSGYQVRIHFWRESPRVFRPFQDWATPGQPLTWYQKYNTVKHNRFDRFNEASLGNVLNAVCGVFAVLFSQFHIYVFQSHKDVTMWSGDDEWHSHDDSIFAIRGPSSWTSDESYHFDWISLKDKPQPFGMFSF